MACLNMNLIRRIQNLVSFTKIRISYSSKEDVRFPSLIAFAPPLKPVAHIPSGKNGKEER